MDAETVMWVRRLDAGAFANFTDEEIWQAYKAKGEELVLKHAADYPVKSTNIQVQAELLRQVCITVHGCLLAKREIDRVAQAELASLVSTNASRGIILSTASASKGVILTQYNIPIGPMPKQHAWLPAIGRPGVRPICFCADCGESKYYRLLSNTCHPIPENLRKGKMETIIASAMMGLRHRSTLLDRDEGVSERNAGVRMRRMDKVEKTGKPWAPKGTTLFPVERAPRRYQDVVGGWNKRAVK